MPEWPNVERAAVAWLRSRVDGAPVFTELPQNHPPGEFVTVERTGGASRWIQKDVDVEVAVHAGSRARMWELAGLVESAMWALDASGDPHGDPPFYIDEVDNRFVFGSDPHPNVALRRAMATFTLTVRPH